MQEIDDERKILRLDLSCILRNQFKWQFIRFIIYNYYLIEAVLASSFYEMYQFSVTTIMPLNIVFFIFIGFDFLYKIACIKPNFKRLIDHKKITKLLYYYLIKQRLIFDLIFIIIFILSYLLPYGSSKYLRLIILMKLVEVIEFNDKINQKLFMYPLIRKIYTVFKISYVILLFSHYFGTWFYLMDQKLLQNSYYGSFTQNPQVYYQMQLLAFTPIQSLGNYGRYLYGLYFMVSLITTIAYGDIIGKNPWEQVYVSFLMVISTISLGLILQQFMDLVSYDSLGIYDFIKNYNSLKTCMDDSQVSLAVQNKVRSYLVYAQYQKRYHAHEEVSSKLTNKLQIDLKVQSYSKGIEQCIIPCMPELKSQVKDLCNICSLVTFQAQSNVYEELETINTATQCGFLYKLSGVTKQFIELSRSTVFICNQQRKQFNLSKMFLNFNLQLAYDSDQEQQGDFQIQAPPQQKKLKRYQLMTINNRKLKCIKISQFVMLDAEQFYEYVNTRKSWFRRIKLLKEQIISRDIPLSLIGDCCPMCKDISAEDHTIQECPLMHLSFNQRIFNSKKLHPLIYRQENRISFKRKKITQRKIKNKTVIQNNIFQILFEAVKPTTNQSGLNEKVVSILKSLLNSVGEGNNSFQKQFDSVYDPNGIQPQYRLGDIEHDLK